MNPQTEWAIRQLEGQRDRAGNGEGRDIMDAIVDWTRDAFEHWDDATVADVIRRLETTDCAACHAPSGLIYNHHIAAKVGEWWSDIDAALAAYQDATGEDYRPPSPPLTIGSLVWFAVEWFAHEMASSLQHAADAAPFEQGE